MEAGRIFGGISVGGQKTGGKIRVNKGRQRGGTVFPRRVLGFHKTGRVIGLGPFPKNPCQTASEVITIFPSKKHPKRGWGTTIMAAETPTQHTKLWGEHAQEREGDREFPSQPAKNGLGGPRKVKGPGPGLATESGKEGDL